MSKEDRLNRKLWAEGCRESILEPHIAPYTDALERGWQHERTYLAKVYNHYHTLIPWRLPDHEEPPLPLPEYDPLAVPTVEPLFAEELTEQAKVLKAKNDVRFSNILSTQILTNRRALQSIRRWLKYRACHLRKDALPSIMSSKSPFVPLLQKLSRISKPPTRALQGWQQFMRIAYQDKIKPEVEKRWAEAVADGMETGQHTASFRANVASTMFGELLEEEQAALKKQAADEKKKAVKAYGEELKKPTSKEPADPQK
jgi:hypothetical protein